MISLYHINMYKAIYAYPAHSLIQEKK